MNKFSLLSLLAKMPFNLTLILCIGFNKKIRKQYGSNETGNYNLKIFSIPKDNYMNKHVNFLSFTRDKENRRFARLN